MNISHVGTLGIIIDIYSAKMNISHVGTLGIIIDIYSD